MPDEPARLYLISPVIEDAEAFARRAPVAVAVGTFVAGFIAARFIKSSSLPPDGRYDRFDDRIS